jgi:hypothetical protein
MNRLKSSECRGGNLRMNNNRILAPNINKTRIKLLNGQITLSISADFQLQLEFPSVVILVINTKQIGPHSLSSRKTPKIGDKMGLKRSQ